MAILLGKRVSVLYIGLFSVLFGLMLVNVQMTAARLGGAHHVALLAVFALPLGLLWYSRYRCKANQSNTTYSLQKLTYLFAVFITLPSVLYLIFLTEFVAIDFQAFRESAVAALNGQIFAGIQPVTSTGRVATYIYPPVTIIFYLLFTVVNMSSGYVVSTALTMIFAIGYALFLCRTMATFKINLSKIDQTLLIGFIVFSLPNVMNILQGRFLDYLIMAGLIIAYQGLHTGTPSRAGRWMGVAAALKGFPTLFGVYFLQERSLTAILHAILVGAGSILLGILLFGLDNTVQYFEAARSFKTIKFAGGVSPHMQVMSLRRPVSILLPDLDPQIMGLVAISVLLPVLLYSYLTIDDVVDELFAYFTTIVVVILALPSSVTYITFCYFPVLPLLYLEPDRQSRMLYAFGLVVASSMFMYRHVLAVANLSFLPSTVSDILVSMLGPIFIFGSAPLYGFILMLVAGVLSKRRRNISIQFKLPYLN